MLAKLIRWTALLAVALLAVPAAAGAGCVAVQLPKGEKIRGPVAKPTLVFSGTVTSINLDRLTVSIDVDRVWTGRLRKATTLVVAGGLEGATVKSFETGKAYLVRYFGDPQPFPVVEPDCPAGTLGVAFSCGDGPTLLAEAGTELKRLGRGRAPLP